MISPNAILVKALLQQATTSGTRSSVLKPIGWMMGIVLTATLAASSLHLPTWMQVVLIIFAVLTMVLYLFAYVYLMFTDRDALRSESYSLRKLEIEKGLVGDDRRGILTPEEREAPDFLLGTSTEKSEDDQ